MEQDISDLLKADNEISGDNNGLSIISVWRLAIHYIMFFMTRITKFKSHYDADSRKSYLCLEDNCPACQAGLKTTEHIYMPVWDVQNRHVVVLRVDSRNDGPARRIAQFVETYRSTLHDVVAVIDCLGDQKGSFTITAHKPLPEADCGALACQAFCKALEAGTIDLRDCVQRLSTDAISSLPSVKKSFTKLVGDPVGLACLPASGKPNGQPLTAGSEV